MMLKQIYMFDMDGTLLDLAYDDFVWNVKVPEYYVSTHSCSDNDIHHLMHQYHQQYKHTLSWYSTQFWSKKLQLDVVEIHRQHAKHIATRPYCTELLTELTQQGHECWLVTNADIKTLNLKLEKTQIGHYFKHIISSEDIGYAKEDAQFWHTLHTHLPFCIKSSVFIDDTAAVLQQAEQFGLKHLWSITQPSSTRTITATHHYPMLDQLTDLLKFLPKPLKEHDEKSH
ncbi:HAD-IA family hydrolase [Acinetobacter rathckeae]|uniref:HAD-IA family hydrolase n=1 Tax=Acinetobacter rathckeae TaxID=2605272 RepID=UPI0018A2B616|nr:HAD-IA family hydrolase [Acinetobacter rathckeae]MBF7687177.1 HAD-IA family hydrolase [Acinetobacter rathckeae]